MIAVDAETWRTGALVAIAVLAVLGLVVMRLVHSIVTRALTLAVTVGLAGLVWSQRSALDECLDEVLASSSGPSPAADTTCSFFGVTVEVPGLPSN